MQFISENYRKLNEQLHAENKQFGNNGHKYLHHVLSLCKQLNTQDILDYGCGKGMLAQQLPFPIREYDPAIEKHKELPEPAELVVCTDVIEHLEEEYLDAVLDHIKSLTKKLAYLVISIEPAMKTLPDGRNAHLIVKPYQWWIEKLLSKFELHNFQHLTNRIQVVVSPLKIETKEVTNG